MYLSYNGRFSDEFSDIQDFDVYSFSYQVTQSLHHNRQDFMVALGKYSMGKYQYRIVTPFKLYFVQMVDKGAPLKGRSYLHGNQDFTEEWRRYKNSSTGTAVAVPFFFNSTCIGQWGSNGIQAIIVAIAHGTITTIVRLGYLLLHIRIQLQSKQVNGWPIGD